MPKENESRKRTIISTRVIEAPAAIVFNAWKDPNILMTWWGPDGFTNTFHEFNFTTGGRWSFIMHGPDGTNYPNTNIFREIDEPHVIVFDHIEPIHAFTATARFVAAGDDTELSFCMQFESAEEYDRVKPFVIDANEQNFNRLEKALKKIISSNTSRV